MKNIYDYTIEELKTYLVQLGEPKYRAGQIFQLLHRGYHIDQMPNLAKELKAHLTQNFACALPEIIDQQLSKDGTQKFLLELHDGQVIECVLLSAEYGKTVCVSSQVGCKMGCKFCASGRDGHIRDLTSGEILAQVILMKKLSEQETLNIVMMGSGEPLDNLDHVSKFIQLVTNKEGLNISVRNISISTVGLPDKIRQLADMKMGVNLCISLHAPLDEVRREIMPTAKRFSVKEIIDSAKYYFEQTGRRVIFEYSLIDGINAEKEHAVLLSRLVKGFPSHVNLIGINKTNDGIFEPPSREKAKQFMDTLIKSGVSCTFRKSKGQDINAACGMLKERRGKP